MKQYLLFLVALIFLVRAQAQETINLAPTVIDSSYREDQIYVGLTFHLMTELPGDIAQKAFSGGFHFGFIRDFPLNERRNIALGTGLGWSINTYGQELFIGQDENGGTIFRDLNALDIDYDVNRFSTQLIEAPIEFRWRTSTPESYKFWRIYAGVKLGYAYFFKSNFRQDGNQVVQNDVPEFQRFRLGSTLTFGYNTFNFHIYYSLNPFFKDAILNQSEIEMSTLKLGLMFYIL